VVDAGRWVLYFLEECTRMLVPSVGLYGLCDHSSAAVSITGLPREKCNTLYNV